MWLLSQARELRAAVDELIQEVTADRGETEKLKRLVQQLVAEAQRSAKVQTAQAAELEQVRQLAKETQRQLNGVKISRGIHKVKAQKLLQDLENRVN